ncbi:hypothetical protein I907_gp56 [Bacillus phage Eoghan]|uniref:Uncharacterized protein n=2 Tax=Andromedavirus TaxID=1623275 RepID=M1IE85_9CAUD|nr:hypothetical protein I907_gp56 [Bacillus phage Eoghan]YP_009592289.1 hypothetical protein FDG68_gp56 [Bacillus phage Taylor]AGE60820.1 hypothetical protein EOGHAN_57 [Bacillus phage Eoghan]AGE60974.1 hypothetical protein TAYLOR_56 [Bacillus phage Taylor]
MNRRQRILHEITLLEEKHEYMCALPEVECLKSCAISKQIKELGEQLKRKNDPVNRQRIDQIVHHCKVEDHPHRDRGDDIIFMRYCGFNLEEFLAPMFKCKKSTISYEQEKSFHKKLLTPKMEKWYTLNKKSQGVEFSL